MAKVEYGVEERGGYLLYKTTSFRKALHAAAEYALKIGNMITVTEYSQDDEGSWLIGDVWKVSVK